MKKAALKALDSGDGGGGADDPFRGGRGGSAEFTADSSGGGEASGADALSVNGLLHGQLQALRSERAALAAALGDLRQRHAAACQQWQAERRELTGSDAAAARIMDLSRRQRHLTAELESERARRRRLEARLAEPAPARAPPPPPAPESVSESGAEDGESAAQLRERLRDTTRRLVEARNQAGAARRELRQAERLLHQEVGEGASLQQLLAAGSGWRGRAQQIVTLRAQLQELQAAPARSEPRLSAADSRARSHLRALSGEQQARARQAADEAERQARQTASLRLKLDAARSRTAVLAQEATQLREQTARLSQKCRNDDEMIELLEAQVRRLEAELADGGRAAVREARQATAPVCGEQVALLRAQLAARDADVARLEGRLAARPAADEAPPPSPPPPAAAAEPAELSELRRRCLEADFTAEAAAVERRRLSELTDELQRRLAEAERRAESAAGALAEERRSALAARREAERLHQVLGRGRRPAPRPAAAEQEPQETAPLREEVQRLAAQLEALRAERQHDLRGFQDTMDEARRIFCRGLREAQSGGGAG